MYHQYPKRSTRFQFSAPENGSDQTSKVPVMEGEGTEKNPKKLTTKIIDAMEKEKKELEKGKYYKIDQTFYTKGHKICVMKYVKYTNEKKDEIYIMSDKEEKEYDEEQKRKEEIKKEKTKVKNEIEEYIRNKYTKKIYKQPCELSIKLQKFNFKNKYPLIIKDTKFLVPINSWNFNSEYTYDSGWWLGVKKIVYQKLNIIVENIDENSETINLNVHIMETTPKEKKQTSGPSDFRPSIISAGF